MKIVETYSHLNGEEYLIVHHKILYDEIMKVIGLVDASKFRTKTSKEKTMKGKKLYNPSALNKKFKELFNAKNWIESRYEYCISTDREIVQEIESLPLPEQKIVIKQRNTELIYSFKQTDFVKDTIAIEVQFGKYAFVAYDLFVKHLLFYAGGIINVGIEILPVKSMTKDPSGGRLMSTGIAYYEGEVYNLLRHGRNSPPVPLLVIGIAP